MNIFFWIIHLQTIIFEFSCSVQCHFITHLITATMSFIYNSIHIYHSFKTVILYHSSIPNALYKSDFNSSITFAFSPMIFDYRL